MEKEAGIASRTLASWELVWGKDRDKLDAKTVFVLEEAGMVSSRQMALIVGHVVVAGAKLVDVRTRAEWDWVGRIPGAIEIEWQSYPGGQPNHDFLAQLRRQVDPESLVMFICRSGVRSHNAASLATEAGYTESYNILEGFEGNVDANGQRGKVGGWRLAGLPWHS